MPAPFEFTSVRPFAVPMRVRFRGVSVREGVVLAGPAGWAEFSPYPDDGDAVVTASYAAAVAHCTRDWPAPIRDRVPVYRTVPAVDPERAHAIAAESGGHTVKVKVGGDAAQDVARVEAVRDSLGPGTHLRVDANGAWDVDTAVRLVRDLDRAANGLQFVEQPCRTAEELARLRRRVDVPIAADESVETAEDLLHVAAIGAADVAVVQCPSLGGVHDAMAVIDRAGLPCVVSSLLETSVGLAAQVALAAALPDLPFACGQATLPMLAGDLVPEAESLAPSQGYLPVRPVRPAPAPELLARHELTDPDRAEWWRARLTRAGKRCGVLG